MDTGCWSGSPGSGSRCHRLAGPDLPPGPVRHETMIWQTSFAIPDSASLLSGCSPKRLLSPSGSSLEWASSVRIGAERPWRATSGGEVGVCARPPHPRLGYDAAPWLADLQLPAVTDAESRPELGALARARRRTPAAMIPAACVGHGK